jgi:hypothetical protein
VGFEIDRNPNLVWVLSCEAVEQTSKNQAGIGWYRSQYMLIERLPEWET